ncbi:TIGR00341 family protein [Aliiglaciecola sp. CAU 1673]|uniref:TIGR00341 family protein n=1 Tax=Aliiglaciecola sp. CAU 1673 TaxID=3032595 RepID=UPI0023DC33FB|nr:TIGR00341 family protein [Aliiglaciecola sp. CAU 1673]MDF2180376.1 TIGR00341 family protein [Aliiglaciecola sp. CAU 1673]
MDCYVIHDDSPEILELLHERSEQLLTRTFGLDPLPPANCRVLLYLSDELVKQLWPHALSLEWELGILPHPKAKQANRAYGTGKIKLVDALDTLIDAKAMPVDMLLCNETPVFTSVIIGELLVFNLKDTSHALSRWQAIRTAIGKFNALRLRAYNLLTANDQKTRVALLGMMILEPNHRFLLGKGASDSLEPADRRLSMIAVAPRSVVAFIMLLIRFLLFGRFESRNLPESIGLARSRKLQIESSDGIDYQLDGVALGAKKLVCEVQERSIKLLTTQAEKQKASLDTGRDLIKLGHLPCGSAVAELAEKPIPMFHHASEDEFRELFRSLRDSAQMSPAFLVLMVLSVLLALTGLFANSAPVIIGAMILAPLMAPIISLAMGLARADTSLLQTSIRTLAGGTMLALSCAMGITWLMPLDTLTPEMQSRLTPTLLDLGVAVISGIAGAYANAKEEVAKSLAGVAIAVALVPPLAVVGIGLGWADLVMAGGAFLLFITNLVGIALSAALTFLVLGFAPFHLARRGVGVSLAFLAIIAIPLYLSFGKLVEKGQIYRSLPQGKMELMGKEVELLPQDIYLEEPTRVAYRLMAPAPLSPYHLDALKAELELRLQRPVILEAEVRIRR